MPTLANQIRQMIDALAVVDPAAAAEFRGSSADRMIPAAQQPGSGFPGTAHNAPPRKKPAVRSQNKPEHTSGIPVHNSEMNLLQVNPMTDSLVKGIC